MTTSPKALKYHLPGKAVRRVLSWGAVSSDTFSVLHLALQIEPDPQRVREWLLETRIRELGNQTAAELIACGRAEEVIRFLQSVQARDRDRGF